MFDDNLPLTRFKLTGSQPTTTRRDHRALPAHAGLPPKPAPAPPQEAVAQR
jgi:hypothetical protein